MKDKIPYFLLIIGFAAFLPLSCIKESKYPSEPQIAYQDFLRYMDFSHPESVELVVSYTDNEGDIGLEQTDKQGLLKEGNFWMIYFWWDTTTNKWNTDNPNTPEIDTVQFIYTIPPALPKESAGEPVKGFIRVKQYPFINPYKKIKYVIYMYDKSFNKSNVIETPPFNF